MAGFAAGAAHALSGADHLAAVAPLAIDRRGGAWRLGLGWGAGHACGVAVLGAVAVALRGRLDLERVSGAGEVVAGLALLGLGLWGWRRALGSFVHVHEHDHGGVRHRHIHLHPAGIEEPHPGGHDHRHVAFGFGVLHGLGGASHLLGVLPALVLPGVHQAAAYVASFALGSLAAMTGCSTLVGALATAGGGARTYRCLLAAAASGALVTGAIWVLP